ncbi:MAG TPA: DUF5666 domain-containing protein [Spirochaetia bacterium]
MKRTALPPRAAFLVLLGLALAPLVASAQSMTSVLPVQGTITAIAAGSITVTTSDGLPRAIALSAKTAVRESRAATLGDIKSGDALGVAARRDGDALIATNINIFPPDVWKVVRKGQFGMPDGQLMTNALVSSYGPAVQGRTLRMDYNGMTTTISVPDACPIHRLVVLRTSDLKVGQTVTVRASSTGSGVFTADTISVDKQA